MRALLQLPVIRTLHERRLLLPAVLGLAVTGVLVQGALEQGVPAQSVEEGTGEDYAPELVESPRPIFRADLEKTPLTYHADYWAQLAEQARPRLTLIGPTAAPAVMVGPRLALTTADAAHAVLEARARRRLTQPTVDDEAVGSQNNDDAVEGDGPFKLRGWDPDIGLALFDVTIGEQSSFTLTDPRSLPSGSYLAAVTLSPTGKPAITPGYLVAAEPSLVGGVGSGLVVSMDLPDTLRIAAIVDLDGALVGLLYAAPDGERVISSSEILTLIESLQGHRQCRSIEVADLSDAVREGLSLESGVLIEYVESSAFDPQPSLRGGDILLEWGGEVIDTADTFYEQYDALEPGALVRYRVLRNRRRVAGGTVLPDADCRPVRPAPIRLPALGLAVAWVDDERVGSETQSGWQVVAVAPDGVAGLSGVEERDWVLALDGETLAEESGRRRFTRLADRPQSLILTLQRGDRTRLVAIAPAD